MQFQVLKQRHRQERESRHPNLRLRVYRVLSWRVIRWLRVRFSTARKPRIASAGRQECETQCCRLNPPTEEVVRG